jgi:DNA-directed RNA polymerase specialized sigma24 family protein
MSFFQTHDGEEEQQLLDRLIAAAQPVVKNVTRSAQRPEDAFQDTMLLIVERLRDLKRNPDAQRIHNFLGYVKTVAYNVVRGQGREARPKRRSAADSLRHLMQGDATFSVWENASREKLYGLAIWRDRQDVHSHSARLNRLIQDPGTTADFDPPLDVPNSSDTELLIGIFAWVDHPIGFNDLVGIVCDLKGIKDSIPLGDGVDGDQPSLSDWLPDTGRLPDEEAEVKEFLEKLWQAIELLSREQRIAYLMNFTAADGELELFMIYGVAGIRAIGKMLSLTSEEFSRLWLGLGLNDDSRRAAALTSYDEQFALLWPYLPLPDETIAKMWNIKRQKVINLRKAAGDWLSRRFAQNKET